MLTVAKVSWISVLFLTGVAVYGQSSAYAQDAAWHVGKSWGEFCINAQVLSGNGNPAFEPGDNIRTGQNGSVVLVRGNESILISSNTEVAISKNSVDELSTTINQRTGSITLEVEPGDMKRFEIETPYLAAVAKGSNLRVVVEENYATVHAFRGEVEVSDFRAGQRVRITTGQTAKTPTRSVAGISLSGAGEFAKVRQVTPRHSRVTPQALSPIASSTAFQARTAEQTFRPRQTHGAGEAYGAGQTDARETHAAIEKFFAVPAQEFDARETRAAIDKFFAVPGQEFDARETRAAIDKFVAVSGQEFDARETRAAIEKFLALPEPSASAGGTKAKTKKSFALSENSVFPPDQQPLGSIGNNGNEEAFENSSPLPSWAIPIVIGVFVTFVAKIFGQKRQTVDRPLDYNY